MSLSDARPTREKSQPATWAPPSNAPSRRGVNVADATIPSETTTAQPRSADKIIKIIRNEDEPKPVLMKTFKLSDVQADAILNMRLRNLRKLEEMEIKSENKELGDEKTAIEKLLRSEKEQWKTVAGQIKEVRDAFSKKTLLGKRRTDFAEAPQHDEAAIEEAMVVRDPITVVVSEKGWIRALRGHQTDLSGVAFKSDDGPRFAFPAETTSKVLLFATNGRFYTIDASKLPGGRGHGEPVRLYADIEQDGELVAAMRYVGGRKFWSAVQAGAASWSRKTIASRTPARGSRCST